MRLAETQLVKKREFLNHVGFHTKINSGVLEVDFGSNGKEKTINNVVFHDKMNPFEIQNIVHVNSYSCFFDRSSNMLISVSESFLQIHNLGKINQVVNLRLRVDDHLMEPYPHKFEETIQSFLVTDSVSTLQEAQLKSNFLPLISLIEPQFNMKKGDILNAVFPG